MISSLAPNNRLYELTYKQMNSEEISTYLKEEKAKAVQDSEAPTCAICASALVEMSVDDENTTVPIVAHRIEDNKNGLLGRLTHPYHLRCLKDWFKQLLDNQLPIDCPLCRRGVNHNSLVPLIFTQEEMQDFESVSFRNIRLIDIKKALKAPAIFLALFALIKAAEGAIEHSPDFFSEFISESLLLGNLTLAMQTLYIFRLVPIHRKCGLASVCLLATLGPVSLIALKFFSGHS